MGITERAISDLGKAAERIAALESQLAEANARIEALTGTNDGATESGAMFCQANAPPPASGAKEEGE